MQAGFDGPQGYPELVGDLGVAESLEVGQEQDLLQGRGHPIDRTLDLPVAFLELQALFRRRDVDLHQVNERLPAVVIPTVDGGRKVDLLSTYSLTKHVPGFVRGNCEEPGLESAGGIECVGGY